MPTLKKSVTEKEQGSLRWARACLLSVNFFAETNRLEPLVAVYLIEAKDWDVVWVGYVSVVMNIIMIVSQTPAGDLMDKTRHKKLVVAASLIVASVTTAAVAWTSELYAVIAIKAAEGVAASMFLPGLMTLLLAVVPTEDVPRTVSLTEVSNKLGSVLFTVGTGERLPDARPRDVPPGEAVDAPRFRRLLAPHLVFVPSWPPPPPAQASPPTTCTPTCRASSTCWAPAGWPRRPP